MSMKVAVSIPEPIFTEAEELARHLTTTRSELYARALGAFVATHAPEQVTCAIDAVIAQVEDGADPFARAAARQVFDRLEW